MTPFSIALTDAQLEVVTWMVARMNAERGGTVTVAQFLQSRVPDLIRPFELKFEDEMSQAVKTSYAAASPEIKALVRETLNVT